MRTARKISRMYAAMSSRHPTSPSSSPMMPKMKSLSEKGRNRYFCRELNSPMPNRPPLPSE